MFFCCSFKENNSLKRINSYRNFDVYRSKQSIAGDQWISSKSTRYISVITIKVA
jgi:hypothetical protein